MQWKKEYQYANFLVNILSLKISPLTRDSLLTTLSAWQLNTMSLHHTSDLNSLNIPAISVLIRVTSIGHVKPLLVRSSALVNWPMF